MLVTWAQFSLSSCKCHISLHVRTTAWRIISALKKGALLPLLLLSLSPLLAGSPALLLPPSTVAARAGTEAISRTEVASQLWPEGWRALRIPEAPETQKQEICSGTYQMLHRQVLHVNIAPFSPASLLFLSSSNTFQHPAEKHLGFSGDLCFQICVSFTELLRCCWTWPDKV